MKIKLPNWSIRQSREGDVVSILEWLRQEKLDYGESFISGQIVIEACHLAGSMYVLIDEDRASPVGFIAGYPNADILSVHPDWRERGIGCELVDHWLKRVCEDDICGVYIECKPITSVKFWKGRGFQQVTSASGSPHSHYRILPLIKANDLPEEARLTEISIDLQNKYDEPMPECSVKVKAGIYGDYYLLETDFVFWTTEGDTRFIIRDGDTRTWNAEAKNIEDIGGERRGGWVRIRELEIV